ncbi:MAG: DUF502 domain-containing protein [Alphaproteobacteria bacterium]|nr:DUF502 domain-containing protein [Alphaproteobacteria bacterium]
MAKKKDNERRQRRDIRRASFLSNLRANFLTGMIVVAPVFFTAYLMWWFVGLIDSFVLPLVPVKYQPERYLGIDIKGYGVIVFLLFTVFVGAMAKGFIGRAVLQWGERLVDRMPIVRSIYNALKQILETVLSQSDSSMDRTPCLVEYPRKGIWAVAFVTTNTKGEVLDKLPGDDFYSVFLPTTPNPTSGFLLFVPKSDVVMLDMDVEAAAKLIISGGLIGPPSKEQRAAAAALAEASGGK